MKEQSRRSEWKTSGKQREESYRQKSERDEKKIAKDETETGLVLDFRFVFVIWVVQRSTCFVLCLLFNETKVG